MPPERKTLNDTERTRKVRIEESSSTSTRSEPSPTRCYSSEKVVETGARAVHLQYGLTFTFSSEERSSFFGPVDFLVIFLVIFLVYYSFWSYWVIFWVYLY